MQCYTNFEPRAEKELDLTSRVVSGLVLGGGQDQGRATAPIGSNSSTTMGPVGWRSAIFEEFLDMKIIYKARSRGR